MFNCLGDGCVAEMTTMLDCIKEHEFENTPCTSQIAAFEACMLKHKETIKEMRSVAREGLLFDEKQKLTFAQINHMMTKYQQPGPSIRNLRDFRMAAHKTFRIKRKLAKCAKINKPVPQWVRMKTGNRIRYNAKRRHWRRTKLKL
uniref:Large ribosomal subunit protein eL39 n=1 Tax=Romanomermis culicivorax TaxID=13658 RepID=A0A915HZK4_ROMCU